MGGFNFQIHVYYMMNSMHKWRSNEALKDVAVV